MTECRGIWLTAAMLMLAPVFSPVFAAEEEVTAARFPDADAVVLDGNEEITYRPDGTFTCVAWQTVKVLTEKGRREESEISISYSARYARAAIESVTIKSADGRVREVDVASCTKETTDNSSAENNIYDPMVRKIVCTVPGVEIGDELTSRTRYENFASRIKDQWADARILEWSCPIIRQSLTVVSPAERPIKSGVLRHPLGNVVFEESVRPDGSLVKTWTATNSPQAFPEPDMPPLHMQVQNIRLSTAEDWRDISRWYWEISLPHLEKTTAAISNKVEELGRDLPSIYRWVAQEVRYMGLTMEAEAPGYAPHDVDITFENRYGVCRDKGALLAAMLRIAGFEAYPVLIHAGVKMDPDVPMPYFNHAIVAVALPEGGAAALGLDESAVTGAGRYVLLDPTDESSRDLLPAYLSDRSFLVARPDGETLLTSSVPPAESNALRIRSKGNLDKDGTLLLDTTVTFGGINDNVYRQALLRRKDEARRKLFERLLLSTASGAEVLDFRMFPGDLQDTSVPLEVHILSRIPRTLLRGESRVELSPVLLSRVLGAVNWLLEGKTSLESRKYPLVVDSTAMAEEELTVNLNGAVGEVISLPADIDRQGDYSYSRVCRVEDGRLVVKRRLAVNAVEFAPEAYGEMRETAKSIEASERERPVFAPNDGEDANSRILFQRASVDVHSPRSWTITNTVCRKILTYDGKKKYAELKFDYNPGWKTVELVSATVSNETGRVVEATEREMNTFDCQWAASAPRYPASRQLIVNLPGVEVGSTITYTVATTVRESPQDFYFSYLFDSFEPVDELTISINGETHQVLRPRMLRSEPMMADGDLWRNIMIVSSNDFAAAAERLRPVAAVAAVGCDGNGEKPWGSTIRSIRDWMAKNVRVAGPSTFETALEAQTTDPAVVLRERYASRLDYVRTLCALLKGAGIDARIVFASRDANEAEAIRRRDIEEIPYVGKFSYPVCMATERKGGFLWFGGEKRTYCLGIENEYTPLGATSFDGSHAFDPATGRCFKIRAADCDLRARTSAEMVYMLRENGDADYEFEEFEWGPGVGAFRKRYEEMLPEDRQRHYQELLGEVAQAASATGELETDTEAYPARRAFKAFVPKMAVADGDTLTLTIPSFAGRIFQLEGGVRSNPLGVDPAEPDVAVVRIVFPEGYTIPEHLPESYKFRNPADQSPWFSYDVSSEVEDGRLVVTLVRTRFRRGYAFLGRDFAALLREWTRLARSRAERTIGARKAR